MAQLEETRVTMSGIEGGFEAVDVADTLQSERSRQRLTWADVTDRLLDIRNLGDDWDGADAEAPAEQVVDGSFGLMRQLRNEGFPPPTSVRATPDGGVSVEWRSDRQCLELELYDDRGGWILSKPGAQTEVHQFTY